MMSKSILWSACCAMAVAFIGWAYLFGNYASFGPFEEVLNYIYYTPLCEPECGWLFRVHENPMVWGLGGLALASLRVCVIVFLANVLLRTRGHRARRVFNYIASAYLLCGIVLAVVLRYVRFPL